MTINKIRTIIDRYYNGTSTPEDIAVLQEFFTNTPDSIIPDDLKTEAMIFKSSHNLSVFESPEEFFDKDFIDEINDAVERERKPSKTQSDTIHRRTFIPYWMKLSAAAILAGVIVFAAIHLVDKTPGNSSDTTNTAKLAATVKQNPDTLIVHSPGNQNTTNFANNSNTSENNSDIDTETQNKSTYSPKPQRIANNKSQEAHQTNVDEYGYIIIDNPEDAQIALSKTARIIKTTFNDADNSLTHIRTTLKHTISDIKSKL